VYQKFTGMSNIALEARHLDISGVIKQSSIQFAFPFGIMPFVVTL